MIFIGIVSILGAIGSSRAVAPLPTIWVDHVDSQLRKVFITAENRGSQSVIICGNGLAWSCDYVSPGGERKLVTVDYSKLDPPRPTVLDYVKLVPNARFRYPAPIDNWIDIEAMMKQGGKFQAKLQPLQPASLGISRSILREQPYLSRVVIGPLRQLGKNSK